MQRAASILIAALAALAALAGSANAAVETPPRVTVIGDSVLTAVQWNAEPLAILQQGLDMRLDIGICRRLTGVSCPFEGNTVPTLIDIADSLGPELGPVVLVEVGYNDDHDMFALNVEQSITALLRAGVQHIIWANLHGSGPHWTDMNAVLDAAARRHPELTVIDWNGFAGDHWSWFQGDSIHLVHDGAMAMATLFRRAIDQVVDPVTIYGAPLPIAHVGRPYAAHFSASGGVGPYRWRITRGSLPKGLSLRPDGTIDGVPRRTGRISIVVSATDSTGLAGTRPETLKIASAT
jgi:hypothetical protein